MNGTDGEIKKKGTRNAEEVAQLVYNFVKSAGSMVSELNGETDETKLLRVLVAAICHRDVSQWKSVVRKHPYIRDCECRVLGQYAGCCTASSWWPGKPSRTPERKLLGGGWWRRGIKVGSPM